MSLIGIVCEFNPFHNGHKYLIDSVKQENDTVICVMSGNYVQRGEPSVFPKEVRVEAALKNGADMVVELPFVYASASAEVFAENAVRILVSLGCNKIAFGTESAGIEELVFLADLFTTKEFNQKTEKYLKTGCNYPVARQKAIDEFNISSDISTPNNILALEYIKALKKIGADTEPVAVSRTGAGYNDNCAYDEFASATFIRNLIYNNESFRKYVPENIYDLYTDNLSSDNFLSAEKYNIILQSLLRTATYESGKEIANMSEGLENRIDNAVRNSIHLNDIYDMAKSKRYTHSRIRRAVLCRALGVTKEVVSAPVPYIRLLGFKNDFSSQIGKIVCHSDLPLIVRFSDIKNIGNNMADKVFTYECISSDIYNLSLNKSRNSTSEKTFSPIKR